jgi:hypothetical protein
VKAYNTVNFKIDKNIAYFDIRKEAAQKNNRGLNFNLSNVSFVVKRIIEILKSKRFKFKEIIILSPYLAQLAIYVKALRKMHEKYLNSKYNRIRVSNIEKFQKLKVEIVFFDIIFTDKIDFLRNSRRFIIVLSRAKYDLYLILNVKNIKNHSRNEFWKRLIFKIKKIKALYVYHNNPYSKWIKSDDTLICYYFSRFRNMPDAPNNNFHLFIESEK